MSFIYRAICFCQKIGSNYNVFYGHSIFWKLTDIDYVVDGWKIKNVQGGIYAFFNDFPSCDAINQLIDTKSLEIDVRSKKYNLIFDWQQRDADFLINDAGDDRYKPFISLCSKAIYYFSSIESDFIEST